MTREEFVKIRVGSVLIDSGVVFIVVESAPLYMKVFYYSPIRKASDWYWIYYDSLQIFTLQLWKV